MGGLQVPIVFRRRKLFPQNPPGMGSMDGNEGSAQALYEGNQTRTAFAGWCAV